MTESPTSATAGSGQLRTLAVRITDDLRAQLDIIAQLNGRTATEEIRLALEHWIVQAKANPETLQRAQQVQSEIERKAQTQRNAIAAIFGNEAAAAAPEGEGAATTEPGGSPSPRSSRRSKPVGE